MADVTVRYASALFELALERDVLDEMIEQADFLLDALTENAFEAVLRNPRIHSSEKRDFLESAFAANVRPELMGLLYLAVEKSREDAIINSLKTLIEMGRRYRGELSAHVVSATELTDEQLSRIGALLSDKMGKRIEVTSDTDPSLIGGIRIQVGEYTIDHTVKKQLDDMKITIRGG